VDVAFLLFWWRSLRLCSGRLRRRRALHSPPPPFLGAGRILVGFFSRRRLDPLLFAGDLGGSLSEEA